MKPMSDFAYFIAILPVYLMGVILLSQIFFGRTKILYVIVWSLLGSTLSMFLSTFGEVLFAISYILFMVCIDNKSDMFWIFLFMDVNLIIVNIQTTAIEMAKTMSPINLNLVCWTSIIISDTFFCLFILWLFLTKKYNQSYTNIYTKEWWYR